MVIRILIVLADWDKLKADINLVQEVVSAGSSKQLYGYICADNTC